MYLSSRTLIRVISFGAALLTAMVGVIIQNNVETKRYRRQLEYSYIHALQEVSSHLNTITIDLQKSNYAGTPAQVATISAKVWREAGSAKAAMSSLPMSEVSMDNTYRFLSQVGDYAMYLSRKATNGQELTAEERQNFEKLSEYARQLNSQIAGIERAVSSGQVDIYEFLEAQAVWNTDEVASTLQNSVIGFQDVEDGFDGYPTLIYDGPFSDNLLKKSPAMTQNAPEVTRGEARQTAARFAGVEAANFFDGYDEESKMPSYHFVGGTVDVGVTKDGGFVTYLVDSRSIGERKLSDSTARQKAREYLKNMGLDNMGETYYEIANGILTVNFAYVQDTVLCYTDLIKVGIAMDDGQVVFYDARGFISNHKERNLPQPTLSQEEAAGSVSPVLTITKRALALIPTNGGNEVLAYEFKCQAPGDQDVLVYVNAENGVEEQILILLENENGTLTV